MRKGSMSCVVVFIALGLLLGLLSAAFVAEANSVGWQVDVYTQNVPYNGVGPGVPSDAFSPEDLVILYANVTYNGYPVQSLLVSFQISGPPNAVSNISLTLTAETGTFGIANTSFTIPSLPEETVLGTWMVNASNTDASDSLSFPVVHIIDIALLSFVESDPPLGGWIIAGLSLSNVAMTSRSAKLALLLYDSSMRVIGSLLVQNFTVEAGGSNFSTAFQIPQWASVGIGSLSVTVLKPDESPYCQPGFVSFLVTYVGDLNHDGIVDITDIAMVEASFGAYVGPPLHPRWNPMCDIDKNGRVDVMDVARVSSNFGKGQNIDP